MKVSEDGAMTDEDIDKMVESASIALAATDPDLAADRERLEDVLDLKTYTVLMAAAMGNDPNWQEAVSLTGTQRPGKIYRY